MKLRNFGAKHPCITFFFAFFLVEIGLNISSWLDMVLESAYAELAGLAITAILALLCLFGFTAGTVRFRKITRANFRRILRDFIFAAYIVFIAHLVFVVFSFANLHGIQLADGMISTDQGLIRLFLSNMPMMLQLLIDAFLTAVTEDSLFICIGFLCVAAIMAKKGRNGRHTSVVVTALLFGFCHILGIISNPGVYGESGFGMFVLGCGLKFVQTSLFGICLVSLFLRTRSVITPVLVHTGFDFFYFLIPCLLTKKLPELFIESGGFVMNVELLTLAGTIILLVPAAWISLRD